MGGGDSLHGAWELVHFEARDESGGVAHPVGRDVAGMIVYTPSGHVSAQIGAGDRPSFASEDVRGATEPESAAAFATYIAYGGTYEVLEDRVRHHVRHSLFPNWVGTVQERFYELDGDDLFLRTPPITVAGRTVVSELRWRRA